MYLLLLAVQMVGIMIPIVGIAVLIKKENSRASIYLMIANIGCLIMNASNFLMIQSKVFGEAFLAMKMELIGNALFYFFFTLFTATYLRLRMSKWFYGIWMVFECTAIAFFWNDNYHDLMFENMQFELAHEMEIYYIDMKFGVVLNIKYAVIAFILLGLLGYTLRCMFRAKVMKERYNLARLVGAEFVILASLVVALSREPKFDIVPIFSSGSVLVIIVSVIQGEFFGIVDIGRQWAFEHMKSVFLIVDGMYGYLDSNAYARKVFPELEYKVKNEVVSKKIQDIFLTEDDSVEIAGQYYDKTITELKQGDILAGYCMMLADVTSQYELMEAYRQEKEKAEEANRAKSIFMSNMSHEIRTPMNAIVGMTDILLRGELPEREQGYLRNIKNSGSALLSTINDILDFSKVESGKMELVEGVYEPMSMLSDIGMIVLNRIGSKKVELLFDIDKELPAKLWGDSLRIRQVIINLMNNAVKFTEEGFIRLSVHVTNKGEQEAELRVSVRDSGQGIKEEDMARLFRAFGQVDTKKNHEKEGTGLGLAISKQYVEMMGGKIEVNSIYGEGSEFFFTIKQKIKSDYKAAELKTGENGTKPTVATRIENVHMLTELRKLTKAYGVRLLEGKEATEPVDFWFYDEKSYLDSREEIEKQKKDGATICLLQNPMLENVLDEHVELVNKPLYSLNFCQVLNREHREVQKELESFLDFTAPKAKILIADDNEVNLKVAKGLLEPLKMNIDTAENGKQALQMIKQNYYDMIFMDHMMPVMDGIEATMALRALDGEYFKSVPVIALTANAIEDARAGFKDAGMNDFVAKPIEMKKICAVIKKWLPSDLIQKMEPVKQEIQHQEEALPEIEGLDVRAGIANSGTKELFLSLLGDFYKLIDMKASKIEKCLQDGMLRDYTIEVHALKSTARMIGAMELSEKSYHLEQLGNAGDVEALVKDTPEMLELYRSYKEILRPYSGMQNQSNVEVSGKELVGLLTTMKEAMDSFDLDTVDEIMKKLEGYRIPDSCHELMEELRAYVADVAMEEVMGTAKKMIEILNV